MTPQWARRLPKAAVAVVICLDALALVCCRQADAFVDAAVRDDPCGVVYGCVFSHTPKRVP